MITKETFDAKRAELDAKFDALDEEENQLERMVFGDDAHTLWSDKIGSEGSFCLVVDDAQRRIDAAIRSGIDIEWICHTKFARYVAQWRQLFMDMKKGNK